jgi:hypothetical protein
LIRKLSNIGIHIRSEPEVINQKDRLGAVIAMQQLIYHHVEMGVNSIQNWPDPLHSQSS